MALAIFMLVFFAAVTWAGAGYVRKARRMRAFLTTPGRIVKRELGRQHDTTEGRWGEGGGYYPKPVYTYAVGGRQYTSDQFAFASRGLKKTIAEQRLAEMPDEVTVHYDPADPQDAYLQRHSPGLGYAICAFGVLGLLVALLSF